MPFFGSKSSRTIFSPKNELLEPLYNLIEKYDSVLAGCSFYEELIETYEYLDQVIKEDEKNVKCTTKA